MREHSMAAGFAGGGEGRVSFGFYRLLGSWLGFVLGS